MNADTLTDCFTLLSTMNCGAEQRWRDALKPLYALVLRPLDDEIGLTAVRWAVLHEEWRPSPAGLRKIAAHVASPVPDAEQSYAEIIVKAQEIGLYGRPHPDRPNIFLEGPPPFSHPILGQIAAYCGGWRFICNGEANFAGSIKRQVEGAHASIAREWFEEVSNQLTIPECRRDVRFFPKWEPFRIPTGWTDVPGIDEMYALPADSIAQKPIAGQIPADVRKMIACIKSVPSVNHVNPPYIERDAARSPFTSEDRAAAEAELLQVREKMEKPMPGEP